MAAIWPQCIKCLSPTCGYCSMITAVWRLVNVAIATRLLAYCHSSVNHISMTWAMTHCWVVLEEKYHIWNAGICKCPCYFAYHKNWPRSDGWLPLLMQPHLIHHFKLNSKDHRLNSKDCNLFLKFNFKHCIWSHTNFRMRKCVILFVRLKKKIQFLIT